MTEKMISLVSGASRGIGKAIALELASNGSYVVGTATTDEGAEKISGYFTDAGVEGRGIKLDVRDEESINACISDVNSQQGNIQVLVNNAGITRDNLLMRMKLEDWETVYETNLRSVFLLSKACLRAMIKAKFGRIINISSAVGATGNPGQANYASTKAGMFGFTKSLAREVGNRGVTVNCVAPGFISTDMTDQLDENQRDQILKNIPMSRLGEPMEIAKAVRFLASEEASYITGHTLHINGGLHME